MGKASSKLVGKKFGLLTVVSKAENDKWGHVRWNCTCECGGTKIVLTCDLNSNKVRSCGCLRHPSGEKSKTWKGGKIKVKCSNPLCNKTKSVYPAYAEKYDKFYCSTKCRTESNGWNIRPRCRVEVNCAYCGKPFEILPSAAAAYENHFCKGTICQGKWISENRTGKNNANYHGGTPEMRIIRKRISGAMRKAIRQEKAGRTWESLVGYDMANLIDRLKETLPKGYSWENDFINGNGTLHIDHIRPMSSFNFDTAEDDEFKECFSPDNLQLLPAIENMEKSAKYEINQKQISM